MILLSFHIQILQKKKQQTMTALENKEIHRKSDDYH